MLLTMAKLSQLAYRRGDETESLWRVELPARIRALGYELVMTLDRQDTQGFIASRDVDGATQLVIVFRGTEPLRGDDLSIDLQCLPRHDRFGKTHSGFAISLDRVWDLVINEIRNFEAFGKTELYFAGHSMGGAMAQIAASRCLREHDVQGLTTFGAPPALRPALARLVSQLLNGRCVRVESGDLVTMLLRSLYRSPGHRLYLTRDGRAIERAARWVALVDRLAIIYASVQARAKAWADGRWRAVLVTPTLISNHSIDRYVQRLTFVTSKERQRDAPPNRRAA